LKCTKAFKKAILKNDAEVTIRGGDGKGVNIWLSARSGTPRNNDNVHTALF
jgi:hypothetical protein